MYLAEDDCRKRWKSIRDYYRRQRKEEKGATGSAANKKRATYWDRLRFLERADDERTTLSNVISDTDNMDNVSVELNEEHSSNHDDSSPAALACEPLPSPQTPQTSQTPRPPISQPPPSKKRKESASILQYINEKKQDRIHFKNCLEELAKPPAVEDEIDLFFKTMAMTVRKFTPDLITQTKVGVFRLVTDMEIFNQQCKDGIDVSQTSSHHSSSPSFNCSTATTPLCNISPTGDIVSEALSHVL